MKKSVITILLALMTFTAMAGDNSLLRIGIGAGLTNAELKSPKDFTGDESVFNDAGTGYNMNLFLRLNIPVLPIYIQPEASYSFQKSIDLKELEKVTIKKLDFPVMAGLKLGVGKIFAFRVNAGPVFNISDSSKDKTQNVRWAAGAGIDLLNHITLDVRYHGRFKSNTYNNIDTNFNYWSYGVGIMF